MLEDSIQDPKKVTCSPFQLYFHQNLFFPDKNSKLHRKLNLALETLLNKLFKLDTEQTERKNNKDIRK